MKQAILPILLALCVACFGASTRCAFAEPPAPAASAAAPAVTATPSASPPRQERDRGPSILDPETLAPLISIPAMFGTTLAIVISALVYRLRRERQRLDTVRFLSEKGHDIPVELLAPPSPKRTSDLKRGLILLLGGTGLSLSLLFAHAADSMGFGLIPGFIGLAYLIVWRVERAHDPSQVRA